jgi:predicted GNAT family acetyltransferase
MISAASGGLRSAPNGGSVIFSVNMPASDLIVRDNASASRLEIQLGDQIAFAEYRLDPRTITFTHTRVPEALRGKAIGTQLITAGLSLARERNLKVVPECPFFAAYIRAHPETEDLLAPAARAQLDK